MRYIRAFAQAGAALIAVASNPAQSATFLVTYTGTVVGSDTDARFGAAGPLATTFTAVYSVTSPLPGAITFSSAEEYAIFGGPYYMASTSSPAYAQLTINGNTLRFNGNFMSEAILLDRINNPKVSSGDDRIITRAWDSEDWQMYHELGASDDFVKALDFAAPIDYIVGNADQRSFFKAGNTTGALIVEHVTTAISLNAVPARALPEPATWLTMLLGFGAIGVGLRRKQQQSGITSRPDIGTRLLHPLRFRGAELL